MGAKTLLTLEQFEQLPEVEGISYELDEGELIEVPTAILLHNLLRDKLARLIANYLNGRGTVVVEQSFQLSPDTVRIPDVAFIAPDQKLDLYASIQRCGPAFAAEIASPSNTLHELLHKTQQYLAAGTNTVWIAMLPSKEVLVYSANAHPRILCGDDLLEDPELFPGFSVRVADLFEI